MPRNPFREVREIIFMGNGDYSLVPCYKLHRRLEEAFILLGGIQQPRHPESLTQLADQIDDDMDTKEKIEAVVRDVAMALTGKEIEFK